MEMYTQCGPRTVQDGAETELRGAKDGSLVVVTAHGQFFEGASRRNVYTATTALAGTTIVAANAAPPAAAAATIFTLYNPMGSGVVASVIRTVITNVSGTPGVGAFAYCGFWGARLSVQGNLTPKGNYLGGVNPQCQAFSQTALTGGLVHQTIGVIGHQSFAGAIAATAWNLITEDNVNGNFVIPPGAALTVANVATGTTHIVNVAMSWEEIPFPLS